MAGGTVSSRACKSEHAHLLRQVQQVVNDARRSQININSYAGADRKIRNPVSVEVPGPGARNVVTRYRGRDAVLVDTFADV